MNNPFGIPDAVFTAMVDSAIKQSTASGRSAVNQQKPSHQEGAKAAKEIYDSYIAVGFTEAQAFELLKTVLTTKRTLF